MLSGENYRYHIGGAEIVQYHFSAPTIFSVLAKWYRESTKSRTLKSRGVVPPVTEKLCTGSTRKVYVMSKSYAFFSRSILRCYHTNAMTPLEEW